MRLFIILQENKLVKKDCRQCRKEFECSEGTSCWCFSEPALKRDQLDYDDCVCKECLLVQYRKKILGV